MPKIIVSTNDGEVIEVFEERDIGNIADKSMARQQLMLDIVQAIKKAKTQECLNVIGNRERE